MTLARAAGCTLATTAALLAPACAGEDGTPFQEQANAVCADYDARIDAVPTPAGLDDLADSAEDVAELIDQGTAALRALEAAEEDAEAYATWLDLNDEAADNARQIAEAAGDEDRDRVLELAVEAEQIEADADALAEELGLDACVVDEPAVSDL